MTSRPAQTISVSIDRDPGAVYAYISDPRHLPEWAPGFAKSVHETDDGWSVETADGAVGIAFAAENTFGVVDHRVTDDRGFDDLNPMRVIANGDGSEVLFTLFQPSGTTAGQFRRDLATVASDLQVLKRVLESHGR